VLAEDGKDRDRVAGGVDGEEQTVLPVIGESSL
jgi:hypothetical protein